MTSETNSRIIGTVKFFSSQKGFGFIETDAVNDDVMIHFSQIKDGGNHGHSDTFRTLFAKDKVSFILKKTDRGYAAHDCELINTFRNQGNADK